MGKDQPRGESRDKSREKDGETGSDGLGAIADLMRRVMALGFAGFFTTEEALRRALGDTVPKDWVDFAATQSQRTRDEISERMAREFGRVLEHLDVADVLDKLLSGRTIEIQASLRLAPEDELDQGSNDRTRVKFSLANGGKG